MNMTGALNKLVIFFEKEKIPYMIFGGLATGIYGYERMTYDIDIKIIHEITDDSLLDLVNKISKIATVIPEEPIEFIHKTMVLPIEIENVKADLVFTGLEYEIESVERAVQGELLGVKAKIISLEDLIIQKSISERDKDWQDIKNLIEVNSKLDWNYLTEKVKMFSDILDKPEILEKIIRLKK
jgi:predicted nucleotidyltransferase